MRRLKYLFTIPDGENVTERHLRRVLISSVCSILLCMSCLVSATWAWFAVELETSTFNVQIATLTPDVEVVPQDEYAIGMISDDGAFELSEGIYDITLKCETNATEDEFGNSNTRYLLLTVTKNGSTDEYYVEFTNDTDGSYTIYDFQVASGESVSLSYSSSWSKPEGAKTIEQLITAIDKVETLTTLEESEDTATSGEGEDTSTPSEGEDTATPGEGEDTATPGEGEDTATPGEGEDTATPGEGEDTATPGEGEDTSTPGEGEDTATPGEGEGTSTPSEGEDTATPAAEE